MPNEPKSAKCEKGICICVHVCLSASNCLCVSGAKCVYIAKYKIIIFGMYVKWAKSTKCKFF